MHPSTLVQVLSLAVLGFAFLFRVIPCVSTARVLSIRPGRTFPKGVSKTVMLSPPESVSLSLKVILPAARDICKE